MTSLPVAPHCSPANATLSVPIYYSDDIILLSNSAKGLQEKLDILNTYCKDWCLTVNTSKTKIRIFNKTGRHIEQTFRYGNENIECVSNCKYLGIWLIHLVNTPMLKMNYINNL